jgi:hypothetical protein
MGRTRLTIRMGRSQSSFGPSRQWAAQPPSSTPRGNFDDQPRAWFVRKLPGPVFDQEQVGSGQLIGYAVGVLEHEESLTVGACCDAFPVWMVKSKSGSAEKPSPQSRRKGRLRPDEHRVPGGSKATFGETGGHNFAIRLASLARSARAWSSSSATAFAAWLSPVLSWAISGEASFSWQRLST